MFIVLKRYHVKDKILRVVDEVSETSGMEQVKILLSQVFKYDYDSLEMKQVSPSTIFRDRLSKESGLTPKEIIQEHLLRTFLLKTLDEKGMNTIKEVSVFCRAYNQDPDKATAGLGLNRAELLDQE